MPWQDLVIAFVVLAFTLSVIPMIRARTAPPYSTSLVMTGGMIALAITYTTLGLWFSFAVEVLGAILWGILIWQKWQADRVPKPEPDLSAIDNVVCHGFVPRSESGAVYLPTNIEAQDERVGGLPPA